MAASSLEQKLSCLEVKLKQENCEARHRINLNLKISRSDPSLVQTLLAFEDVAVYFSEEEWALLDELQKDIYKNTMRENYETLLSLGLTNMKPEIIAKIDAGEAPSVRNGSYLEKQGKKNAAGRALGRLINTTRKPQHSVCSGKVQSLQSAEKGKAQAVQSQEWRKGVGQHKSKEHLSSPAENVKNLYPHVGEGCGPGARDQQQPVPSFTSRIHSCLYCDKRFTQRGHLLRHHRSHLGQKPYGCTVCEKSFSSNSYLTVHQRTHTGERPYVCNECERSYSRRSALVQHLRAHTGERPYYCTQCKKSFSRRESHVEHQRTHTGERPFHCPQCIKCFRHKRNLVEHLKTHSSNRSFECSDCKKSFCQKRNFLEHLKLHSADRPHKCPDCERSFTKRSLLIQHQRMHTGEKPFQCTECERSFSRKESLVDHMSKHTGETPYVCSYCGQNFGQKRTLRVHRKTHTDAGAQSAYVNRSSSPIPMLS